MPFAQIGARLTRQVDLRTVGTGTVSGTSLYREAGFGPLAAAGVADVAKGSVGPLLAPPDRPLVTALAAGAAVAGHNWSPWLRGAGGRGISPAMGAMLPGNWPGSAVLIAGLAIGRLVRQTGLGSFLALVALVPTLRRTRGRPGALVGCAVALPMVVKRLTGNGPPARPGASVYLSRLLFDRDGRGADA